MLLLPVALGALAGSHRTLHHKRAAPKQNEEKSLDDSIRLVDTGQGNQSTVQRLKNDGILPSVLSPTIAEAEKSGKIKWTSLKGDDGTITKFADMDYDDYQEAQDKALHAYFNGQNNGSAPKLMRRDGRRRKAPSFRGLLKDFWDGYADLNDIKYGVIAKYDTTREDAMDSAERKLQVWFDEWTEKHGGYDFVCRDAGPYGWGSHKQSEMVNFCAFVGMPIAATAATLALPGVGAAGGLAAGKLASIVGKSRLLNKVDYASKGQSVSIMKHLGLNIAAKQRHGPTHFTMSSELCHRAIGKMLQKGCRAGEFQIDDDDGYRDYIMNFDQTTDDYDCDGNYPDDYASDFDASYPQDQYDFVEEAPTSNNQDPPPRQGGGRRPPPEDYGYPPPPKGYYQRGAPRPRPVPPPSRAQFQPQACTWDDGRPPPQGRGYPPGRGAPYAASDRDYYDDGW
ncbi:MAG: hypothetical protein Q9165_006126 [Trypethelium subeluteriae]